MKLSAACAFVVGTVALDIGSTISMTEAAAIVVFGEEDNDNEATAAAAKSTKNSKNNGLHSQPAASSSSALGIQDGHVCSIKLKRQRTYTLRATLGNETVLFLERPNRGAAKVSTQVFVDKFDKVFTSSSPNVAITFAGDKEPSSSSSSSSASLDRPLIVILSKPSIIGGLDGSSTLDVEYTIKQSESQSAVATIEQFLDASGSCSIFIDSIEREIDW